MKNTSLFFFMGLVFLLSGQLLYGQCKDIPLADSSFEEGTYDRFPCCDSGYWYRSDGCNISGQVSYTGDTAACTISGGAYQYISVDSNTTYYLSCYVLNGLSDYPGVRLNGNANFTWVSPPSDNWSLISVSFTTGSQTDIQVGFDAGSACFDEFRLTCAQQTVGRDRLIDPDRVHVGYDYNAAHFRLTTDIRGNWSLYDLQGRMHAQASIDHGEAHFGQQLAAGIYLFHLSDGTSVFTQKLIKP